MALPSLLTMPAEIRVLIYHFLFRDIEVVVHDLPRESTRSLQADSSQHSSYSHYIGTDRKTCISLLLANRLISKEATAVFRRETNFTVGNCPCWESGELYKDSLTIPRRALPDIHHVTVRAVRRTEPGFLKHLLTVISTWNRITGKDGFPSKLETLKIEGLPSVRVLDHYISLRHSIATKISVTMLPMVGWLPSDPREPLIGVVIEGLRVTISVPRRADLVAIKRDFTQRISAVRNLVVVLNVCGEGSRDFW